MWKNLPEFGNLAENTWPKKREISPTVSHKVTIQMMFEHFEAVHVRVAQRTLKHWSIEGITNNCIAMRERRPNKLSSVVSFQYSYCCLCKEYAPSITSAHTHTQTQWRDCASLGYENIRKKNNCRLKNERVRRIHWAEPYTMQTFFSYLMLLCVPTQPLMPNFNK